MKKLIVALLIGALTLNASYLVFASDMDGDFGIQSVEGQSADNEISMEEFSLDTEEAELGTMQINEEDETEDAESKMSFTDHLAEEYGIDPDLFCENLYSNIAEDTSISFADLFAQSGCMMDLIDDSLYDITAVSGYDSVDLSLVNLEYDNLSDSLGTYYSENSLAGYSQGCMQLFKNTYGDLASELALSEPSLPDGFTVENMMNTANSAVSEAYSSVTNSGTFASVKNQISIGNVFAQAQAGPTTYSLASTGTLNNMLGLSADYGVSDMRAGYYAGASNASYVASQALDSQNAKLTDYGQKLSAFANNEDYTSDLGGLNISSNENRVFESEDENPSPNVVKKTEEYIEDDGVVSGIAEGIGEFAHEGADWWDGVLGEGNVVSWALNGIGTGFDTVGWALNSDNFYYTEDDIPEDASRGFSGNR